jgi:predicted ferric reductase
MSGFFWISLYMLVIFVPVLVMLVPPTPSGRGFWLELSVALGFIGLTQIAVQFILIARFKTVTAPYGIDIILQYHRQIALVAVAAILLHPLIIVIDNPSRLKLMNPVGGNWASRCAWVSVFSLLGIVLTSVFREKLKLRYEVWRGIHLVLGVTAIVFAQLHVSMAGLYTNTLWKQLVWVAMAVAMVGMVIYLRLIKPAWQREYRWKVAEIKPERGSTYTLILDAVDHEGINFLPGQFAWLKLAGSPFTLEEHPFSFSSSAESPERIEFGIKALGDFTSKIGEVAIGTRAYLDGPHGAFTIDRYATMGYVFVAGGVGITPFLSILKTMKDRNDPRPVLMFYSAENLEEAAFREVLDELMEPLDLTLVYVLEKPEDGWDGETGFIDADKLQKHLPKDYKHRHFFVCGPPPMMDAVHDALHDLEVPEAHIQMEKFNLA